MTDGPSRLERRHERVKQEIVTAATAVVREHGVEGLSLRLIATQMDVTAASLYRYFASKEALVAELVEQAKDQLRLHMERVPAGGPHDQRLIGLGLAYLEFAGQSPDLFKLAFLDSPSGRTTVGAPLSQRSPYGILLEAVRAGLTDESAETIAYTIWSLAHGMAVLEQGHLRHFQADFSAAHRHGLGLLVRGLCEDPCDR